MTIVWQVAANFHRHRYLLFPTVKTRQVDLAAESYMHQHVSLPDKARPTVYGNIGRVGRRSVHFRLKELL